jgi:hypothetical protein
LAREKGVNSMFGSLGPIGPSTQIVSILVGIAVLLFGRNLFWLFVGAVGFVIGLSLAVQLLGDQPDWVILLAAIAGGVIGALIAVPLQKIAVMIAGFIIGGYVLIWLLMQIGFDFSQLAWLVFVIGGVIGAILVSLLFEVALIILSSLAGATLIVQSLNFDPQIATLLFVVLAIVGIVVQAQMQRRNVSAR